MVANNMNVKGVLACVNLKNVSHIIYINGLYINHNEQLEKKSGSDLKTKLRKKYIYIF